MNLTNRAYARWNLAVECLYYTDGLGAMNFQYFRVVLPGEPELSEAVGAGDPFRALYEIEVRVEDRSFEEALCLDLAPDFLDVLANVAQELGEVEIEVAPSSSLAISDVEGRTVSADEVPEDLALLALASDFGITLVAEFELANRTIEICNNIRAVNGDRISAWGARRAKELSTIVAV